jgi:hypothetical protein
MLREKIKSRHALVIYPIWAALAGKVSSHEKEAPQIKAG